MSPKHSEEFIAFLQSCADEHGKGWKISLRDIGKGKYLSLFKIEFENKLIAVEPDTESPTKEDVFKLLDYAEKIY